MIPKIFHHIWFGKQPMPVDFHRYLATWKSHHPHWLVRMWDDSNIFPLINQKEFEEAHHLAQKADIARYEILYRYGGVYVDCDFECLKNIEWLCNNDGFCGEEYDNTLCNAIIGAKPKHPLLKTMIEDIPARIKAGGDVCVTTGPKLLSKYGYGRTDFQIVDRTILYPRHYEGTWWGPLDQASAIHHWAKSWVEL